MWFYNIILFTLNIVHSKYRWHYMFKLFTTLLGNIVKTLGERRFGCLSSVWDVWLSMITCRIATSWMEQSAQFLFISKPCKCLLQLIHRYRRQQTVRAHGQCGWRHWVQRVGYRSFLCLIKIVGSLVLSICAFFVVCFIYLMLICLSKEYSMKLIPQLKHVDQILFNFNN